MRARQIALSALGITPSSSLQQQAVTILDPLTHPHISLHLKYLPSTSFLSLRSSQHSTKLTGIWLFGFLFVHHTPDPNLSCQKALATCFVHLWPAHDPGIMTGQVSDGSPRVNKAAGTGANTLEKIQEGDKVATRQVTVQCPSSSNPSPATSSREAITDTLQPSSVDLPKMRSASPAAAAGKTDNISMHAQRRAPKV